MLVKEDLYIVLTAGELRLPVLQLCMYLWNKLVFYFSYVKFLQRAVRKDNKTNERYVCMYLFTYLNSNWSISYGLHSTYICRTITSLAISVTTS